MCIRDRTKVKEIVKDPEVAELLSPKFTIGCKRLCVDTGYFEAFNRDNVTLIDSAIKKSELGLNPQIDGQLIRLPVPDLSEERRNEMKKIIKSMGEKCKISIRNIRREANDELKKLLKSKDISEDDLKKNEKKDSRSH